MKKSANLTLIISIIFFGILLSVSYIFADNEMFNKFNKNTDEIYAYKPVLKKIIPGKDSEENITFKHVRALSGKESKKIYLYKDENENNIFIDPENENVIGIQYKEPLNIGAFLNKDISSVQSEDKRNTQKYVEKLEEFLSLLIDISKYELSDCILNEALSTVDFHWSRNVYDIMTCDSVTVVTDFGGEILFFYFNQEGFYSENREELYKLADSSLKAIFNDESLVKENDKTSEKIPEEINARDIIAIEKTLGYINEQVQGSYDRDSCKIINFSVCMEKDFHVYGKYLLKIELTDEDIAKGIKSVYKINLNLQNLNVEING